MEDTSPSNSRTLPSFPYHLLLGSFAIGGMIRIFGNDNLHEMLP